MEKIEGDWPKLGSIVDHTIGVQIGGKNMKYKNQFIKDLFIFNEKKQGFTLYKNVVSINRYSQPIIDGYINFDLELGKKVNKGVRDANIALPNNLPFINKHKIILRQSSSRLVATILEPGETSEHKFFQFKLKSSQKYELEYLLGLINSTLLTFYAWERNIIKHGEKKQPQIRIKEVIKLPIAFDRDIATKIVVIVNKILSLTKLEGYPKNSDTGRQVAEYEKQIDNLVYELYGLSDTEKDIVEGAFEVN